MAISSFNTNYSGRKRDILIFNDTDPTQESNQVVDVRLSGNIKYCTGVQKLIQKYTILFLTNLNSQLFFPQEGTTFLSSLTYNISSTTEGVLRQLFSLMNLKIVKDLEIDAISNASPDDEKISRVTLRDVLYEQDALNMTIEIKTLAGDNIAFVLPLPLGD
jgi:hypothetical protein